MDSINLEYHSRGNNKEEIITKADLLLDNKVSLLDYPPQDVGSPIDWLMTPAGDKQWQSHLGYMYFQNILIDAYQITNKECYLDKWVEIMEDFIKNHPYGVKGLDYNRTKPMYLNEYKYGCGGEGKLPDYLGGSWIGLACSSRTDNWLDSLKLFAGNKNISSITIANILASLVTDHAYLMINNPRRYTPNQALHVAMALTKIGIVLSEFKMASSCYLIGMEYLEAAINMCVLPDGTNIEQSFNYNSGLPRSFCELLKLYKGQRTKRIAQLVDKVKKLCVFLGTAVNPLGLYPDLAKTHSTEKIIPMLKDFNKKYDIKELKGIVKGLKGKENDINYTSKCFIYGGYYFMRTGWSKNDMYMMFKASRNAIGHMHEDCNSLVLTASGRNLLVDSGHFNYADDELSKKVNDYCYSSFSHNTVCVDNKSQNRLPYQKNDKEWLERLQEPINKRWYTSSNFDVAEGEYSDGYGEDLIPVTHNRQIVFIRGLFWLVLDRLQSEKTHRYTQIWNLTNEFKPEEVVVDKENKFIKSSDQKGTNILIKNFASQQLDYRLLYGEKDPYRGWYTIDYGKKVESVDVHVEWEGTGTEYLTTLLYPFVGKMDLDIKTLEFSNNSPGVTAFEAFIDGEHVICLIADEKGKLYYESIEAKAECLVIRKQTHDTLVCLALECEELKVNTQSINTDKFSIMEFEVSGNKINVLN